MNRQIKQFLTYLGIVVFFLVISYAFVPQVLGGKIVNQSDISGWTGMTHEISQHNAAHPDDPTYWTNSMFGGMPTVTMYDKFEGDLTNPLYKLLLLGKRPATYLFVALLGAFLLMLSMGINRFLAVGGAIAVAFCSYNFQIIQVGHNTKMQAIAFFPWVLAAMIYTYRSAFSDGKKGWLWKVLPGSALFGLALSFQIKANHPQITWYLATCVVMAALAEFVTVLMDRKDLKDKLVRFFSASALLLVLGIAGIATNANKLIPTYDYSKATMRGGSELGQSDGSKGSKGLDLDYATAWSYGIGETPNLMIANYNGGSSAGELSADSQTAKVLKQYGYSGKNLKDTLKAMPLYWGPQPFTAGPMYMGAISVFLFVLGLFLCKGKEKWWMLAATVFAVLLGWGNHMMWFTKLCFDILPMYNKFRTVSMSLVVLQVTIPLLGFYALDRILKGEHSWAEVKKAGIISLVLTAGFCALSLLIPSLAGDFVSAADAQLPEQLVAAIQADRIALLRHDALISLVLILVAAGLIAWACMAKDETRGKRVTTAAAVICLLILADLFVTGKRYLNADHFISPKDFSSQFEARAVDQMILEDDDPDYRVLDMSVNTFNDSHPSYWHKTIGGYSPAKMQRYQDLIDHYITREMNAIVKVANETQTVSGVTENFPQTPVLNMLNTKYVVLQDDVPPVVNSHAYGNCWFVDGLILADNADEELTLLGAVDLRSTAIVRREDAVEVPESGWDIYDADEIRLVSYAANELHYAYRTSVPRVAVFSEVYYPGWVSDQVELFRADWTLRAAMVPAGEGEIVMRFEPQSYKRGENISRASSILLLLVLLASLVAPVAACKRDEQ
ncbi:MAG: hypothetical protein MJY72_00395 [Bacteroidales bacterium]|nr:hypothetical protein [Bacteroidales bacterium]